MEKIQEFYNFDNQITHITKTPPSDLVNFYNSVKSIIEPRLAQLEEEDFDIIQDGQYQELLTEFKRLETNKYTWCEKCNTDKNTPQCIWCENCQECCQVAGSCLSIEKLDEEQTKHFSNPSDVKSFTQCSKSNCDVCLFVKNCK